MFTFFRTSGIIIPRRYDSEQFYWQIKEFLKRRSRKYNTPDFIVNTFYIETDKALIIPRFFPVERFVECKIIDKFKEGETINISHNIVPRTKTQKRAIQYLSTYNEGILELEPGVGKTVVSIYTVAKKKKKTFVLVHRDSLADQWKGEKNSDPPQGFLSFTNLEENDIARLTSSTFEDDLKKPIIICTDQTFISLLKRNRNKFLSELNRANIGIFIADEVHTSVGAPSFSNCSIHIPAKYVYGLSATPYRYDGNGDIIKFHLGNIFSDEDIEGTMIPKVIVMLLDYKIDIPYRHKYLYWEGEFQRSRYLSLMKNSKSFMEVSKNLLKELKSNKNILFVAERIKVIDILYNWLNSDSKSKFIGNSKMDQLKYNIVFATPGKVRDGVDIPKKDTLIMTSPISNIKQMVGRVLRTCEGKIEPVIIDMVDFGCTDILDTFYNRLRFYENNNWTIQFTVILNKKAKLIDREAVINILKGE